MWHVCALIGTELTLLSARKLKQTGLYVQDRMWLKNKLPMWIELETRVPRAANKYQDTAEMIARSNKCKNDLQVKRAFETKESSMCISVAVPGMIMVKEWLLCKILWKKEALRIRVSSILIC